MPSKPSYGEGAQYAVVPSKIDRKAIMAALGDGSLFLTLGIPKPHVHPVEEEEDSIEALFDSPKHTPKEQQKKEKKKKNAYLYADATDAEKEGKRKRQAMKQVEREFADQIRKAQASAEPPPERVTKKPKIPVSIFSEPASPEEATQSAPFLVPMTGVLKRYAKNILVHAQSGVWTRVPDVFHETLKRKRPEELTLTDIAQHPAIIPAWEIWASIKDCI